MSDVKIIVTFAVAAEWAGWRRRRRFEPRSDGAVFGAVQETRIGRAVVGVTLTGIGPVRAREVRAVLERERPDMCIASGLSGGLRAGIGRSAIVVPREVVRGEGSGRVSARRSTDGWLTAQAEACGARVVPTLVSTDRILVRAAEKAAWAGVADIVDMESSSVLDAAAALGIPAVAIRSISDGVDDEMPVDFNELLKADGGLNRLGLALAVAGHPRLVGSLVRFGRESLRAASALVRFLDAYVERLAVGATDRRQAEVNAG